MLRDALEKEYEVLVTPAPADVGLYVQGTKSSVSLAYSRICNLADTIPSARAHMPTNQFMPPSSNLDPDSQRLLIRDSTTTSVSSTSYAKSAAVNAKISYRQGSPHSYVEKEIDTRSQKLVAQYVKLGFPVEQVQSVIESLGPSASENDIMSRLVKINPARPSPSLQFEKIQVPSKEGLRPIVIDGSNVAMK